MGTTKKPEQVKAKGAGTSVKAGKAGAGVPEPEWANGLKKLYDSVVDEPLPDSFKDLLAKLDDSSEEGAS